MEWYSVARDGWRLSATREVHSFMSVASGAVRRDVAGPAVWVLDELAVADWETVRTIIAARDKVFSGLTPDVACRYVLPAGAAYVLQGITLTSGEAHAIMQGADPVAVLLQGRVRLAIVPDWS